MKPDRRKAWSYRGYQITPVATMRSQHWGKCAEPLGGDGRHSNFYWSIHLSHGSCVPSATKASCRELIDAANLVGDGK